jgi:hypothetical protein
MLADLGRFLPTTEVWAIWRDSLPPCPQGEQVGRLTVGRLHLTREMRPHILGRTLAKTQG